MRKEQWLLEQVAAKKVLPENISWILDNKLHETWLTGDGVNNYAEREVNFFYMPEKAVLNSDRDMETLCMRISLIKNGTWQTDNVPASIENTVFLCTKEGCKAVAAVFRAWYYMPKSEENLEEEE